ncbi:dephospho-CoA kinase [Candidatus Pelagibacter bacterium]|nr:dephospho-CoA kinase [Candidatus Pelagibacter bacterium]
MIKIGITGSLASGKTTASKILSYRRGPLFSADKAVKEIYKNKHFKFLASKRFRVKNNSQLKKSLKLLILKKKDNIKKLERIIHPLVRKKMKNFTLQNRNKKLLFYEIPLLIESKLMKHFNVIVFIKAKKQLRLRRFRSKSGDKKLFNLLNNKQMNDIKKIKFCDHVVVNEKNLNILKKNLLAIISKYE